MSLSDLEATRALVFIEEGIERLELLRCLTKHDESNQISKRSPTTSSTMSSLLNHQNHMQERYEELAQRRRVIRSGLDKRSEALRGNAEEIEVEFDETVENLRHCRSSIARAMGSDDPEHIRKLNELRKERNTLCDQLKQLVFDLSQPDHTYTSLSEKVS